MPRARRNPARTAPTERAAPKATADGTALPLFPNRRKRAADGNRTSTEKETKRICIGTSLTIKKGALRLLAVLSGSRTDSARSAVLLRGRKESSERSAELLRGRKESSEHSAMLLRDNKGASETSAEVTLLNYHKRFLHITTIWRIFYFTPDFSRFTHIVILYRARKA